MTTLTVPSSQYPTIESAVDAAPTGATIIINGAHSENVTIDDKMKLTLDIRGSLSDSVITVNKSLVEIIDGRFITSRVVAIDSRTELHQCSFEANGLARVIECKRCTIDWQQLAIDGAGFADGGFEHAVFLTHCGGAIRHSAIRNTKGRSQSTAMFVGDGSVYLQDVEMTDNTESASGGAVRVHNCSVTHEDCTYLRNGKPGIDATSQLGASGNDPHHHLLHNCELSMEPVAEGATT